MVHSFRCVQAAQLLILLCPFPSPSRYGKDWETYKKLVPARLVAFLLLDTCPGPIGQPADKRLQLVISSGSSRTFTEIGRCIVELAKSYVVKQYWKECRSERKEDVLAFEEGAESNSHEVTVIQF